MSEPTTTPDPEADEGFHDTGAGPDEGEDEPGQAAGTEPELPF